jgi:hypothetical protein
MLGLYGVLLWNHFVLSLLSGAFLLWAMLKGDPAITPGMLNQCSVLSTNPHVQAFCEHNFKQLQSLITGATVGMWIIQLGVSDSLLIGCRLNICLGAAIICSRFVSLASKAEDESNVYAGPEAAILWAPQTPQSGGVEVPEEAMPVDGEEEEYKTPRTAEFSRYSWV